MSAREVIELSEAYVEVEARPGYLFVVETGQLTRLSEVKRYTARLDAIARRLERTKALIDARGEVGDPPADVREAMWSWLTSSERAFDSIAFVLATEMAVARVNMIALSRRAPLRAFDAVQAAQRWLLRDPKLSGNLTEPRISSSSPPPPSSSVPPAPPPLSEVRRSARPSPSVYRSTDAPSDHVPRPGDRRGGGSQSA
ncbi:MAG: hypothetical protein KF729_29205 [Sandaracinaceae bacterium]|nr:hypothetical protein [Sandaracinaceae bacterium]